MVNFYPEFVSCSDTANVSQVADHIDHIKNMAGIDYIGVGSDFDGVPTVPAGLEDVSKFTNLTAELIRRGYSDQDVIKVMGGNLLRAFRKAEDVAKRLQGASSPSEVIIDRSFVLDDKCRTVIEGV
eukprot:TRINITY_DN3578_c0_g1_i2.p2 TRINITY_DN3578_c0_g1~~TRINITY_DN3578_c0_g1_i2.p2  ORF type:complete len:126 (-),score=37.14 TRINITY_DN3578_c0_g1_i2:19-396(-)